MRKPIALAAALAVALVIGAASAQAGTGTSPEITDVAGDANFVNGQGLAPGHEQGPSTAPASLASDDLLSVWFETAYSTNKVMDPSTGKVARVEHTPTAVLVHIKTSAPVHPTNPQGRAVWYSVRAALQECNVNFELRANGSDASKDSELLQVTSGQCGSFSTGSGPTVSVMPTYDGAVATLRYPLTDPGMGSLLYPGATISQASARVTAPTISSFFVADEAAPGATTFSLGQDVPANVDCSTDPSNPECA